MVKEAYITQLLKEKHHTGPITGFEACKKCKGMCCYRNACSCAPADVGEEVTVQSVERMLATGKYMITATYVVDKTCQTSLPVPIRAIPHISAREVDAGEIHISLLHSKCALLGKNGCTLTREERPTQGLLLIPKNDEECEELMPFMSEIWKPYIKVLEEVVKRKTGMTSQQHFEKEALSLLRSLRMKLCTATMYHGSITHGEYMALRAFDSWGALPQHESWALKEVVNVVLPDYPGQ